MLDLWYKNKLIMKTFYRIENVETKQGLWYDINGNFTGLIHNEYKFCKNTDLQMPYCELTKGYLSVTDSYEDLLNWVDEYDILRLKEFGYKVSVYESNNYYHNGNHYLIKQNDCKFIKFL